MRSLHGCMSGSRCESFAHGSADATATIPKNYARKMLWTLGNGKSQLKMLYSSHKDSMWVNISRQSYIVCERTRIPCYLVKCLYEVFDVEHNYHQFVGRPYVKRFVICYLTVVCPSVCPACLSCPVCDVGVWWPKVGWIQVKLGMQVGLGPGHILLDGDPGPPPQRATAPPIYGPY